MSGSDGEITQLLQAWRGGGDMYALTVARGFLLRRLKGTL
jgi:hypothetical protein